MAGTGQDSNVVADLGIKIGVITDDTGLSKFINDIRKNIDKLTYKGNTKKSGFSENVKDLEMSIKRYRALLEATYKQAHKLSLTDTMGGFKKGDDGKILATERAYKKLVSTLREVEKAMNALDPTALEQSNRLRRARIKEAEILEKEAFLRDPSNKFNFSDFKKAYSAITRDARNGEFDKDAYSTLKNRFNYIKREDLTKREQWDYDKYARDFEKNLHWKNFLLDNRKDVLSELLGLDAKSVKEKQTQILKLKAFIDDTLFKKKFGVFGTDIQQGIVESQNKIAGDRIKEIENEIKKERAEARRMMERARKERERKKKQQEKAEERELNRLIKEEEQVKREKQRAEEKELNRAIRVEENEKRRKIAEEKELNRLIEKEEREKARQEKERQRQAERQRKETQRNIVNTNKNSFSDIRYQYRDNIKNGINPFTNEEFKKSFANIDKTKLSHNQMREYERMAANMERIAKMEAKRRKDTLQTTVELQRQNTVLGGLTKRYGQLGAMARQYFNLWAVKAYLDNILNITAEFDRQRRALGSLIDDQAKAVTMFNQIKNMALQSPYTTLELMTTAKGLVAYDIEVKDLVKDTKMLGDIAAATGVDIQRLVLAYGQVKTATWLKGQEARQFSEAGVPLLRALANRYSALEGREVTTREVQEYMSNRQISFEDVQASLRAMTEEGGKFYNMQETIAETTYGKIQKIRDAWQQGLSQISRGDVIGSLVHGFLDVVLKIAKNISNIIPHLLTIGATMLVINQRGKLTMKYAEKELALLERREMLVQQRDRWANVAKTATGEERKHANRMSSYYGSQIDGIDNDIKDRVKNATALREINAEIQKNATSTKFWDKRVKVLGLTFKRLGKTAKIVLIDIKNSLKAFLASNWVTILLMGLVEVVNMIRNIGAATRQLNNDLRDIETESTKKTVELVNGFEKTARAAVSAADGSKKQADALGSLAQMYGDIIPLEQMSIENLKALKDNYEGLTNQIKMYQEIQAGKEKRSTILESDKYKEDWEEGIKAYYTDEKDKVKFVDSDIMEEIVRELKPEWVEGLITDYDDYQKRLQEKLQEKGIEVPINGFIFSEDARKAIKEIQQKASTESVENRYMGKKGAEAVRRQKKLAEAERESIANAKTGAEFAKERNELLEKYADTMSKTLGDGVTKADAMRYLLGEITDATLLQGKGLDKNSRTYSQMLQTTNAIKNNFYGLYDGIDVFSVKSKEVLDIWKDSYITMNNLKEILEASSDDPYTNFVNKKDLKDRAMKFLKTVREQPSMQLYNEKGYNTSVEEIDMVLNATPENAESVKEYFNKKKEKDLDLKKSQKIYGDEIGTQIYNNRQKAYKEINNALEFPLEELEDSDNKKGGSGESIFAKWKRDMNDWIGMLDKARQHYKELRDLFFDETALNKTVAAYEKQFKMYEGQFMDIMKRVNINSLKEWISTEENYVRGLEAIIAEVEEMIASANGKDKKELQEFKFYLSQKISNEQIKNIKDGIRRFIEEVERQMEVVSGRIDIWGKIFEKTNNGYLADMFTKTFLGSGSRDAINTMKNGFSNLLFKAMTMAADEQGQAVMENILEMFNKDVIDFSAIENLIADPRIPLEVRSQMLKIFKEFKQANQQILEEGMEFYQKTRTIEEQRIDVYVKAQQRINEISKMQVSDRLKNKVIDNVLNGMRVQMAELELEAIKSSEVYQTLFNNIETAGVSSLKMLRDQIEALKDSFKDDPVKLKALNSELKKIDEKLEPTQYKLGDIFKIPSVSELRDYMNNISKADKEVRENRENVVKLNDKRQSVVNKRESERNSAETKARIGELADGFMQELLNENYSEDVAAQYATNKARLQVDNEIDAKFKDTIDGLDDAIIAANEEVQKSTEKRSAAEQKLMDAESLRAKAIEQMTKRIEDAFKFSSSLLGFGRSVAQSLTANSIFKGKYSDSNMMNVYANDVQAAFKAVEEYNNAFKNVMDSALDLWKRVSDSIAENNGRNALQDKTPMERNTSALLQLTEAIYSLSNKEMPEILKQQIDFDNKYKGGVDTKKKLDGMAIASIGFGAGLGAINMIGSGDYRSGSKGMMSSVGGGLMMTGEPYSMAAGAALTLGAAIWDAADKIHDSDIRKRIDELQDKYDELGDVITATNNRIRKSAGNEVISGKRENIGTQKMQLANLEKQLKEAKSMKGVSKEEIKSYEKRIKEMKQSIESAEMDLFESILGSGIDEYMKNLISIFEDAAKSGENTFKALKNSFGESLASMVQDTIMATMIKNRLQKFFEQVEQISKQGGMGIGMTDDIIATGLEAMEDVNSDLRNMQPLINRINTAFRVNSSTAGSLASGVKGMSEETAGQMSGYLIANFDRLGEIQKSVFAIEKAVGGNTASGMMTQYQQDAITHLAQIEANTLRNANKLDQFYSLIDSMKVVNTSGSGAVYGIQTMN